MKDVSQCCKSHLTVPQVISLSGLSRVLSRMNGGFASPCGRYKSSVSLAVGREEAAAGLLCWEPYRHGPKLLAQIWAQLVEEVG